MSDESIPLRREDATGVTGYLTEMWRFRHFCLHLVAADVRSRFRRSYLGIVWAVLHPLFFAVILGYFLSSFFGQTFADYATFVLIGIMVWDLISSSLGFGSSTFVVAEGYLKQNRMPALLFPLRTALGLFTVHVIGILGFIIFTALFKHDAINWTWAYYPVFLVLVLLFMIPLCVISGFLALVFRDYNQAIGVFLQMLVYLSPIYLAREVYSSPQLGPVSAVNPVTQFCDLLRGLAIHGQPPALDHILVIGAWIAGAWIVAIILLLRYEKKLPFML